MHKIIESEIIGDPWKHKIIKNFFDTFDFEKVNIACTKLYDRYKDQLITADNCLSVAEVYDIIGQEVFDIILNMNKSILDNVDEIIKPFNARTYDRYVSLPSFHILPPHSGWQIIHDEAVDKTISIVVYLYPESSVGTVLYKTKNRDSFAKEIPWQPNNAMLFCGEKGITWHDFGSRETPRVTLNFFVRTLKHTEKTNLGYTWTFGNGLKSYIPEHVFPLLKDRI
jgi:hypothetical protein